MTDNVAQNNSKISLNRTVPASQPLAVNNRITNSADHLQQGSNASLLNKPRSESWFALANDVNKGPETSSKTDTTVFFSIEQGQLNTGCDFSQIKADCYSLIPIWCNQCHGCGHLSRDCPDSAPVDGARRRICANCCSTTHTDHNNDCPFKLCSTCLESGHLPSECSKPSRKSMICHRCSLKGHERLFCPTIWRDYFLTTSTSTTNGRYPNKQPLMQITNPKKFCCLCAGQGHFHFECHLNGENTQGAVGYQGRNFERKGRPFVSKGPPLQQNNFFHNSINRQHSRNTQNMSNGLRNKPFHNFIPQKQGDPKFGKKLTNGYPTAKSNPHEQNNGNQYGFEQTRGFSSQPLNTLRLGHPLIASLPNSFVSTPSTPSSTVTASNFGADTTSKMNIFPDILPTFISSVNTNSGTPYFGPVLNPALPLQAHYSNSFSTSELPTMLNGLSVVENEDRQITSNEHPDSGGNGAVLSASDVAVNGTSDEVPNLISDGPSTSHSRINSDHSSSTGISNSGATKGTSVTSKHANSSETLDDSQSI